MEREKKVTEMNEANRDIWDAAADVVVVGAGGAGLAAAVESAAAGADTVVYEKLGTSLATSTAISGGVFSFAGTDFQNRERPSDKDQTDSNDLLYRDIMNAGQRKNDPRLVDLYIQNQMDTFHWLTALGVTWNSIVSGAGMSIPRGHRTDPKRLIKILASAAEKKGAKLIYRSPAVRLVTDSLNRVTGLCVARSGKEERVQARKGVVLSTGGFGRNPDRLNAVAPGFDKVGILVGTGHTGDGHQMAESLGAVVKDCEFIKPTFGTHATSKSSSSLVLLIYFGAILVNRSGKRFINESAGYKEIGMAALDQPGGVGYQIFDQKIYARVTSSRDVPAARAEKVNALSLTADTVEELAEKIGIPPVSLKQTVDVYNRHVAEGNDPDFGRTTKVGGIGKTVKIDTPPFYAYASKGVLVGTYGGLSVDHRMRVLGQTGEIPNLYAAGELVGGFHGAGYMTGTALAKAVIFGRIAGRNAAGG